MIVRAGKWRKWRAEQTWGRSCYFQPQVEVLEDRCCPSGGGVQWSDPDIIGSADGVYSVLSQPSGKIVLVGNSFDTKFKPHFTLAELDSNGSLDPNFGSGGSVITQKGNITPVNAYDAVLYPTGGSGDEKILAVGFAEESDFALVRYNADGSLDTSFGTNGMVGTNFKQGRGPQINGVVLVPTGTSLPKIVMAGGSANDTGIELARYNPDGSLDTTFGSKGTVYVPITGTSGVTGLALDPASGDLIVSGSVLAAFKSNGTLDSSFGQNGLVNTGIVDQWGLAVYPATDGAGNAGKILAGGPGEVARYNASGTLDTGWGGTGIVTGLMSGRAVTSIAIQPDDKVVLAAAGWSVARLNNDGSLDSSFGSGGISSSGLAGGIPPNIAVTLQANGDIIEGGTGKVGTINAFAAVCYLPSEPVIGSFTANPNPVPSGSTETLTVSNLTDGNPDATITQVAFYYIDGSGNQQLLGYGTQTSPGVWTLTFTVSRPAGSYTLVAQAEDSYGVFSPQTTLTLQVT
jgi:uncharacterized delta-60 repeat protein